MDFPDVVVFAEILFQRGVTAFDPDFQVGIHVEGSGRLYRKLFHGTVGDGEVFALLSGDALCIENDEAFVGEYPFVADQFIGFFHLFPVAEQTAKLFLQVGGIHFGNIAEEGVDDSHDSKYLLGCFLL